MSEIETELPDTQDESGQIEGEPEAGEESGEVSEQEQPKKLEMTQEELDAIVQKAKAKAKRQAERKFASQYEGQQRQAPPSQHIDPPKRSDYASDDEWIDAKIEHRQRLAQVEQSRASVAQQQREMARRSDDLYDQAEELPGFDREVFEDLLDSHELSGQWAMALLESDQAPQVMEYLTLNPKEFARLSELSPSRQVAELGKIETKLAQAKKGAAKPINPVKGINKPIALDPNKMTDAEYYRMKQEQKRDLYKR